MTKKNYYIKHDRDICIGCSACASVNPKYWKMDDKDGKSNIIVDLDEKTKLLKKLGEIKENQIHAKNTGNGEEEILGDKNQTINIDLDENLEAAESCPVNCIHIVEVDDDKNEKEII